MTHKEKNWWDEILPREGRKPFSKSKIIRMFNPLCNPRGDKYWRTERFLQFPVLIFLTLIAGIFIGVIIRDFFSETAMNSRQLHGSVFGLGMVLFIAIVPIWKIVSARKRSLRAIEECYEKGVLKEIIAFFKSKNT